MLLVAAGGAIGAAARYLAGLWIVARLGAEFPWGTFFVNAFSYETLQLLSGGGSLGPVLFNTFGQLLAGLLAVYLGVVCGRALGGM